MVIVFKTIGSPNKRISAAAAATTTSKATTTTPVATTKATTAKINLTKQWLSLH